MPVRVEFVEQATDDLIGYARSGKPVAFVSARLHLAGSPTEGTSYITSVKELLRLEEFGADAGSSSAIELLSC